MSVGQSGRPTRASAKPKTQLWPSIFPGQATDTYCNSMVFIKQLTLVGVSTITYLRNVLPESCYTYDSLAGIKIRAIKSNADNEMARFLYVALSHAFEAFEKQFLHQLTICFYGGECQPENLLEFHSFEYKYKDGGGVSMEVTHGTKDKHAFKGCMDDVKEQTVTMIRGCMVLLETFNKLPEILDVTVRVYYNENAPEGYQVPGFRPASHIDDPLVTPGFDNIRHNGVQTPYHSLQLTSFTRDQEWISREALASQNAPEMTQSPMDGDFSPTQSSAPIVKCVCDVKARKYDVDSPLLTCFYCATRQHAICYGVISVDGLNRHCCVECADQGKAEPTDQQLHKTAKDKRGSVAIFRSTVNMCSRLKDVSVKELSSRLRIPEHTATKLFMSLAKLGVVSMISDDKDKTTRVNIDHNCLSEVRKDYFQIDIVEQLVEETLMTQETQHDPIGHVLGPIRQVSLQNASRISRVIDSQDTNNNNDNPTLKQYKEALVKIPRMELDLSLSLSGSKAQEEKDNIGKKRKNTEVDGKNSKVGVMVKKAKTTPKKSRA